MALFTRFTSKNAGLNWFNQEISDLTKKLRGFVAKKQDDFTHKQGNHVWSFNGGLSKGIYVVYNDIYIYIYYYYIYILYYISLYIIIYIYIYLIYCLTIKERWVWYDFSNHETWRGFLIQQRDESLRNGHQDVPLIVSKTSESADDSYGHLSVITGYFSGITHSINGVISTYSWYLGP